MFSASRFLLRVILLSALLTVTGFCSSAYASWGDLDPTFGSGGVTMSNTIDFPRGTVVQPDGKVLLIGQNWDTATIERFLPNGAVDTSFGTGGTAELVDPDLAFSAFSAIALQPDGKIVVDGLAEDATTTLGLIARFNPDGTLDTTTDSTPASSFGTAGKGYLTFQDGTTTTSLADVSVLDNGEILAGGGFGTYADWKPMAVRFNADGSRDDAFDSASKTSLTGLTQEEYGEAYSVPGADGSVFLVFDDNSGTLTLAHLNSDGTPDDSVFDGGLETLDLDSFGFGASDTITTKDGKVVVVGSISDGTSSVGAAVRFETDGEVDASFGDDGLSIVDADPDADSDYLTNVSEMPSGELAVSGVVSDSSYQQYTAAVLHQDGGVDEAFGDSGTAWLQDFENFASWGLSVQADGKLLVSGFSYQNNGAGDEPFIDRLENPSPSKPVAPVIQKPIVPDSAIGSPASSVVKASRLLTFSGSALPAGSISRVQISLQRVDPGLLKKGKECLWLSNAKAKFAKVKARQKKCGSPRWLTATGTSSWSYKLKKQLPKGTYLLQVRATGTDGVVESRIPFKKFKVT